MKQNYTIQAHTGNFLVSKHIEHYSCETVTEAKDKAEKEVVAEWGEGAYLETITRDSDKAIVWKKDCPRWYMTFVTLFRRKFLLIRTDERFILSDKECMHNIGTRTVPAPVEADEDYITLDEILVGENDDPIGDADIAEWIHYFGIKTRIHDNYYLLNKSIQEIGITETILPDWHLNNREGK